MESIRKGHLVRTVKGAKFVGRVLVTYVDSIGEPGAVVEAISKDFFGTKHVYPLRQLEIYEP